jgi:hypothetical protein
VLACQHFIKDRLGLQTRSKAALLDDGRDFSELVSDLLAGWWKSQD